MRTLVQLLIFAIVMLLGTAAIAQTKTPFATTPSPIYNRYAYTNNGMWFDSSLIAVKYRGDSTIIMFDGNGKAFSMPKNHFLTSAAIGDYATISYVDSLTNVEFPENFFQLRGALVFPANSDGISADEHDGLINTWGIWNETTGSANLHYILSKDLKEVIWVDTMAGIKPFHNPAFLKISNNMELIMGGDGLTQPNNDVVLWTRSSPTDSAGTATIIGNFPDYRYLTAVTHNDDFTSIIVHRGQYEYTGGKLFTDVESNDTGKTWHYVTVTADTFFTGNMSGTITKIKNLWVKLGYYVYTSPRVNEPYVWTSPDRLVWTRRANAPITAGAYPWFFTNDTSGYYIGGTTGVPSTGNPQGNLNQFVKVDVDENDSLVYTMVNAHNNLLTPFVPVHATVVAPYGSYFAMIGGHTIYNNTYAISLNNTVPIQQVSDFSIYGMLPANGIVSDIGNLLFPNASTSLKTADANGGFGIQGSKQRTIGGTELSVGSQDSINHTTGIVTILSVGGRDIRSTGTSTLNHINVGGPVIQSGGTLTTKGININNTMTSLLGSYYGVYIDIPTGTGTRYALWNNYNIPIHSLGNMNLGATTEYGSAKLNVTGTVAISLLTDTVTGGTKKIVLWDSVGKGLYSVYTLLKSDVGLGNVDNTSDASKPVSTAQQTALNLKLDANGISSVGGSILFPAAASIRTPNATVLDLQSTDSSANTGSSVRIGLTAYQTQTSGTHTMLLVTGTFAPTSGTGVDRGFSYVRAINQTGGASGISSAFYVAPSITAAADFRGLWLNYNLAGTYGVYQSGALSKNVFFGETNVGTATSDASAIFQVTSTTKGLLPPRMTTTQRDAISSPTAGLTIYNSTTTKIETWDGSVWQAHW